MATKEKERQRVELPTPRTDQDWLAMRLYDLYREWLGEGKPMRETERTPASA
jgi:hypothetical protein